jgi:hypothetical protein
MTNGNFTHIKFLEREKFERLGKLGSLKKELPRDSRLNSCGVYAISIPSNYHLRILRLRVTRKKHNVINPWLSQKIREKWVNGVEIVYYGIAGRFARRTLRKRLTDLLNHAQGKVSEHGPHKGGEILWQLTGVANFSLWFKATNDPPEPRVLECRYLNGFFSKVGKLPFANRMK